MFSALFNSAGAASAADPVAPLSAPVLAPDFQLDGRDGAALSAAWWQWVKAAPPDENPVRDRTGASCATGQTGDVWFLAGGFGSSSIARRCTVPAGKTLFFPLINMMYFPASAGNGYTCATAQANAALNNDSAIDLFADIDGVAVPDLRRYRYRTERCFNVFANIPAAERPYDAFPSASDGYWLAVGPLAKGTHRITFGGLYNQHTQAYGRMIQDINYTIDVR